MPPQKKRIGPAPVSPLSRDGVRYEAIHAGKAQGLEQNGGYLAAIDEQSGDVKWRLKVYAVVYSGDKEPDKEDVFITDIGWSDNQPNQLQVQNERGEQFTVDVLNQTVQPA